MIFFAVLAVATGVAAALLRDRRAAARWGLAVAMAVAGFTHLARPIPFEQHLPDWVPAAGALVAATGLIEIALGLALALSRSRRLAGAVTAAYLAAVFPANVYVAVEGVEVEGQPGGIYPWIRLPLQALFHRLGAVEHACSAARRPRAARSGERPRSQALAPPGRRLGSVAMPRGAC